MANGSSSKLKIISTKLSSNFNSEYAEKIWIHGLAAKLAAVFATLRKFQDLFRLAATWHAGYQIISASGCFFSTGLT